jgi:glutamate-1-semialdehyde 2,1-aminomutase
MDGTSRYRASHDLHVRARRTIAGGVNSNVRLAATPWPLAFARAAGSRIWDVDGNEYVDFAMGMGTHILGHQPPAVVDAVRRSLDAGQLFAGQHALECRLAESIVAIAPWIERVRFGLSGTEMNLLALRLARVATGRQRFVRFDGHYHGWLDPVLSAGTGSPLPGQSAAAMADEVVVQWNDLAALDAALSRGGIAAVVMEPVMCNTGCIPPAPGYLAGVKELCVRHGAVWVVDEVITGFRMSLAGAQGAFGVHGDVTIFAKAMGAGFPIAALGASADLLAGVADGTVNHSGTYNTGLSSVAAAVASLDELLASRPHDRIVRAGRRLAAGLSGRPTRSGHVLRVEGPGPMVQLRFGDEIPPTGPDGFRASSQPEVLRSFLAAWQDRGVRTTNRGMCFLSAAHSDDDVDRAVDAAMDALESI